MKRTGTRCLALLLAIFLTCASLPLAGRAAAAESGSAVLLSGGESRDVAVFIPWWGDDVNFRLDHYYAGVKLADAMGGSCRRYLGEEATVDAIADALSSCRVVIISTHGTPGCLTLRTGEGITEEDIADGLARNDAAGPDTWYVSGDCIVRHMDGQEVSADYVSLNACSSMGSAGLAQPLMDAGAELVFGWSRPTTMFHDQLLLGFFTDALIEGKTAAEAFAQAKQQVCRYVLDSNGCQNAAVNAMLENSGSMDWDMWQAHGALTAEEAAAADAAFPIIVSSDDPYPGEAGVQAVQTVTSGWTLPLDAAGRTDIHTWGWRGDYFAAFFPDAVESIALESGELPPGVEIGSRDWTYDPKAATIVDTPCLHGTPTEAGCFEAVLRVTLADGSEELRSAEILIAAKSVQESEEEIVVLPGEDGTVSFSDGHAGEIFRLERVSGQVPPGMTFFSDGGNLRYCGAPLNAGLFAATYRIVTEAGKVIDHTVSIRVPEDYRVTSEDLFLQQDEYHEVYLGFDGADEVLSMEMTGGALPEGMNFGCSISRAPHYYGLPASEGTSRAVFRVVLESGAVLTHTVNTTVYAETESINYYAMDLSLGASVVSAEDYAAWLYRSLSCAEQAGQILTQSPGSTRTTIDLDMDGNADVLMLKKSDGSRVFRQTEESSLTGDDFDLILNAEALGKASLWGVEDGSAGFVKTIRFHLSDNYDLYVAGTQVTSRNREDVLGDGAFSFDGTNTLSVCGSYTASASGTLIENGIDGLIIRTSGNYTLRSWGNVVETDRSLILEGSGRLNLVSDYGSGIVCESSVLTIRNTVVTVQALSGKGITGTGSASVYARVKKSTVSIRSGEGAMDGFWALSLHNCMVTNPLKGGVSTSGSRRCLVDGEGTLLDSAMITPYDTAYALVIDGVQVTERNRGDVLKNGVFSFDGDRTLTIAGSYESATEAVVSSAVSGLVIRASQEAVLRTGDQDGLFLEGNAMLTGEPLTVISGSAMGYGIHLGEEASLTVSGMTLTAQGTLYGIRGAGEGASLAVRSSDVTAVGSKKAAIQAAGGLELVRCYIASPEGGFCGDSGLVTDALGETAKEVVIAAVGADSVSVSGSVLSYSVWLPGSGEAASLVAAWYDADGRMLGCAVQESARDGLKAGTMEVGEEGAEYRLFVPDPDSGAPLCPALSCGK